MRKQRHKGVNVIMATKIRKRGCSSSSSSSSKIHRYRLNKRTVMGGRSRAGLGGPRSVSDSPKSSQPVSARRLAASLWEMNEIPNMVFKREKMQSKWRTHSSDSSPPHLSEPSRSPTVSEMDRSGICGQRRTPSLSRRIRSAEQNDSVFESLCQAGFSEIENRSRPPTSNGSVNDNTNRLKGVSNALTISKELLKIMNRIWIQTDQPSSIKSVILALHAELERARTQVNHLMQEQQTENRDINNLIIRFTQEKTRWKNKEHQAIEAAITSISNELEVERKLRRRLESLNKNLGKELTDTKSSFKKAVEELESEKRAREITEQVCDELARNADEDRAQVEKLKSESVKLHKETKKEREMLELADKLREGRVQMKLTEAKHQFEEKSSAISKLRKQLEAFLGAKRDKDENRAVFLIKSNISSNQSSKADSTESDHNSIELASANNTSKFQKWSTSSSAVAHEVKARNSIYDKEDGRRSVLEERQRYIAVKGLNDHVLSSPRSSVTRDCYSPSQQPLTSRKSKW